MARIREFCVQARMHMQSSIFLGKAVNLEYSQGVWAFAALREFKISLHHDTSKNFMMKGRKQFADITTQPRSRPCQSFHRSRSARFLWDSPVDYKNAGFTNLAIWKNQPQITS